MKVALIAKPGHPDSGVGRYVQHLQQALARRSIEVYVVYPQVPLPGLLNYTVKKLFGWDLEAFFSNYPIWTCYPRADLYHLTSQNLATLMLFCRPPGNTVATIHDVIPWVTRKDSELRVYRHWLEATFDRLALRGLRKVDGFIADSDHTRKVVCQHLNFDADLVRTIPLGID